MSAHTTVDPATEPVAELEYDEDLMESFEGPGGLLEFFNEEEEQDYYDDDDVDQQYVDADPLETSASQRVAHREATHAVSRSAHTQLIEGQIHIIWSKALSWHRHCSNCRTVLSLECLPLRKAL